MTKKGGSSGGYEVGYSKPPKHTRFKPGGSGNPKGRPKGSKNLGSLISDALSKKVRVTENGKVRTISLAEAMVRGLTARAARGELRATELVLRLIQQHLPGGEEPEIMKVFIQRFTDGEILAEKTLQVGGGGQSTDWRYLSPKKGSGDAADQKDEGADEEASTSNRSRKHRSAN